MQPSQAKITALLIATTIFILLLAVFVIALVYKYKKRQQRYEEDLLSARLEMQEQTLQHIARELHDNISGRLTSCKLTLNTLTYHQPDVARSNVAGCTEDITTVLTDLRALGQSLDGDYIAANGLLAALRQELERTQKRTGIAAVLHTGSDIPLLSDAAELFIFRIVQEALQNIIKHAGATSATVAMACSKTTLTITITDDGRGIAPNPKKGMGIINMKRRAALIGGQFYLQPAPGGGTMAQLILPNQP
jgi:two-component system, NarL family, sensor kinase